MNLLKKYRIEHGLTQDELAIEMGITRTYVNYYEHGEIKTNKQAVKLAEFLGCTRMEILGDKCFKFEPESDDEIFDMIKLLLDKIKDDSSYDVIHNMIDLTRQEEPVFIEGVKFGDRLKQMRESRNLSKRELFRLTGISCSTIADIEFNLRVPTPIIINKLCKAFNCKYQDFIE